MAVSFIIYRWILRSIIANLAKILLTPFRTQNIPPPMSSCQILVPSSGALTSSDMRTPIHASFSSTEDVLAALWETGYIELWNLNTRIETACQKVMEPILLWSGRIPAVHSVRQIG